MKIYITKAQCNTLLQALEKHIEQLKEDAEIAKEYPRVKADFDNQIDKLSPIIELLESYRDSE